MGGVVSFRKTDFADISKAKGESPRLVIAIDGPAGSGKGTLAKRMAERFHFAHLDTGALYRAVGYAVLETGGDPSSLPDVMEGLKLVQRNLTPELLASAELRSRAVTDAASKVAVFQEVRDALLEYQRNFAQNPPAGVAGVVIDGRDIGTVVCPNADVKLFVTASAEVRATRRCEELMQNGVAVAYDEVLKDVQERDARDSGRSIAPTKAADDAFILDTSALNPSETLGEAMNLVRAKIMNDTTEIAE